METGKKLHFTLGPVQSYVAQARKTRDLWAGSFLLSYLTGQAMLAIIKGGGKILFPTVHESVPGGRLQFPQDLPKISDQLLKSLLEKDAGLTPTNPTSIGSLPNRFLAEIPESLRPEAIADQVRQSWLKLADAVWERFLANSYGKGKNGGRVTRAIWRRQVEGYWEIAWALGNADNLLDLPKNWRDYIPTVEDGDKCTLMGNLQELSGFCGAPGYKGERALQKQFWRSVRQNCSGFDLGEDERLCAIAFIKRFYPYLDREVIGWELPQHYYSTPYMAAMDWLAASLKQKPEEMQKYSERVRELLAQGKSKSQEHHRFAIPQKIRQAKTGLDDQQLAQIANINGDCFYQAAVANQANWPDIPRDNLQQLGEELEQLQQSLGSKPQPHYVLLLMDWDRMGALIQEYGGEQVSLSLREFTQSVESIVNGHSGVTIYAGGDDVLALLPFQEALKAASALEKAYWDAFAARSFAERATASIALVYAHYSIPLMSVYREAARALDQVAKEATGRHSLAITFWKGSGPQGTWAMPWSLLGYQEDGDNKLEQLVQLVRNKRATNFTAGFLYKLGTYFEMDKNRGAETTIAFDDEQMVELMLAEFIKTKEDRQEYNREAIRQDLQLLLAVAHKYYRSKDGSVKKTGQLIMVGPLLVKFLADNWGDELCDCG